MQLVPSIESRERLFLFGGSGGGKSNAVLSIARRIAPNKVYVVDNDDSYDRLLATDFTDLDNVEVYNVDSGDWEEQLEVARETRKQAGRDDFWVYDMSTELWTAVQSWFTNKVYGVDHADYFLELRMQDERQIGESGRGKNPVVRRQTDDRWTVITAQYKKFEAVILGNGLGLDRDTKSHVICCAEATKIENDDSRELKNEFGGVRVRPKGNKRAPHLFQTIILMEKAGFGQWTMTTVKDRGREEMEQVPVKDFGMDYLYKVAKWKMTSSGSTTESNDSH